MQKISSKTAWICWDYICWRRVRSDSVQSDQKSVQEEMEEENESSQEKKLPGDLLSLFCLKGTYSASL